LSDSQEEQGETTPNATTTHNKTSGNEPTDKVKQSTDSVVEARVSTSEKPEKATSPEQGEMPFALVHGEAFTNLPKDLYIPPDALEVILESFAGPLDLLLYLIRKQNIDILEIDVSDIPRQYVTYVEMMEAIHFELAAEYLVMAAMLAEIKSRMLLPRSKNEEEDEGEDPRAQLIRRLQEYERFKNAAEDIDTLPRMHRDEVLRRADMFTSHHVEREKLSTRERMSQVLNQLSGQPFMPFVNLFHVEEGRLGVVVTFLAVMELIKEQLVEIVQTEIFAPIHVKARGNITMSESGE